MLLWKTGEGSKAVPRVVDHRRDLRMHSEKYGGDLGELSFDVFTIGPSEDGADDRVDHNLRAFRHSILKNRMFAFSMCSPHP